MKKIILFSILVCSVLNIFSIEVPPVTSAVPDIGSSEVCTVDKVNVDVAPCRAPEAKKVAVSSDEFHKKLNEYNQKKAAREVHYMYMKTFILATMVTGVNAAVMTGLKSRFVSSVLPVAIATTMTQAAAISAADLISNKIVNSVEKKHVAPSNLEE